MVDYSLRIWNAVTTTNIFQALQKKYYLYLSKHSQIFHFQVSHVQRYLHIFWHRSSRRKFAHFDKNGQNVAIVRAMPPHYVVKYARADTSSQRQCLILTHFCKIKHRFVLFCNTPFADYCAGGKRLFSVIRLIIRDLRGFLENLFCLAR